MPPAEFVQVADWRDAVLFIVVILLMYAATIFLKKDENK